MAMRNLMKDRVTLVKADGARFENVRALVGGGEIHTDEAKLPIEEGDKFERRLPSGLTEVYIVLGRGFYHGMGGIPDHYQVKVRKETELRLRQGPTVYNITGPNSRVNINSTDLSANVVNIGPDALFEELVKAISTGVTDSKRKATLTALVRELEQAKGTPRFVDRYRTFVAAAADHMTLLSPFIPALTQLLQ